MTRPGKARSVRALLAFQEFLEKPGKQGENFPHLQGFSLCAKTTGASDKKDFWHSLALP